MFVVVPGNLAVEMALFAKVGSVLNTLRTNRSLLGLKLNLILSTWLPPAVILATNSPFESLLIKVLPRA